MLVEDAMYELRGDCAYGLGIASIEDVPVTVTVTEEITADVLYIHGDLQVSGALTADAIYVTGTISGMEQIQCDTIYDGDGVNRRYQIRILERNVV